MIKIIMYTNLLYQLSRENGGGILTKCGNYVWDNVTYIHCGLCVYLQFTLQSHNAKEISSHLSKQPTLKSKGENCVWAFQERYRNHGQRGRGGTKYEDRLSNGRFQIETCCI